MYHVFGYDWELNHFDVEFDSFVTAVMAYRRLRFNTVFIKRDKPNTCLFVR